MSNTVPTSSALRALALEYKSLQEEPVEGFRVKLLGEDNLFEWEVAIFGPPDTLYQGGYFKVSTLYVGIINLTATVSIIYTKKKNHDYSCTQCFSEYLLEVF